MINEVSKPLKQEDGTYEYKGWTLAKVNSNRWDASKDDTEFSVKSLGKAAAEIDLRETLGTDDTGTETLEAEEPKAAPTGGDIAGLAGRKGKKPVAARKAKSTRIEDVPTEDLVTPRSRKITNQMVRDIRAGWDALGGSGKMAYYRATAQKYGLGLETVAKISRRDSHQEVPEQEEDDE